MTWWKSAHDFFTLDSRLRWRVMGLVCLHIHIWKSLLSATKLSVNEITHTVIYSAQLSIYQVWNAHTEIYQDVPSVSQYEHFIPSCPGGQDSRCRTWTLHFCHRNLACITLYFCQYFVNIRVMHYVKRTCLGLFTWRQLSQLSFFIFGFYGRD